LVDILSADPAVSRSGVHLNWGTSLRRQLFADQSETDLGETVTAAA
jgi:hypothetical protein